MFNSISFNSANFNSQSSIGVLLRTIVISEPTIIYSMNNASISFMSSDMTFNSSNDNDIILTSSDTASKLQEININTVL